MSDRREEQQRILAGMKAYGLRGRAVDDLWVCDNGDCEDSPEVRSEVVVPCPSCGKTMFQVLVQGEPVVLS